MSTGSTCSEWTTLQSSKPTHTRTLLWTLPLKETNNNLYMTCEHHRSCSPCGATHQRKESNNPDPSEDEETEARQQIQTVGTAITLVVYTTVYMWYEEQTGRLSAQALHMTRKKPEIGWHTEDEVSQRDLVIWVARNNIIQRFLTNCAQRFPSWFSPLYPSVLCCPAYMEQNSMDGRIRDMLQIVTEMITL